ncbi:MAG: O-linked N-acetylglucosamine transferase, SPINDLY family protein [Rivularia sp. (in: Bacteria)]|nr:O-linked N-acetylglucosamine transferase, SPINDLY family protein [Rivularia sp. MS3]
MILRKEIYQYLIQEKYDQSIKLIKQSIETDPLKVTNYWYLGLVLLLQGEEIEAQMTWMLPLAEAEPEQFENWITELTQILQAEAERRKDIQDYQTSWLIRQHIKEINPEYLNNLLHIIQLSVFLDLSNVREIPLLEIAKLINSISELNIKNYLLLETLEEVLKFYPRHPHTLDFVEACILNSSNYIYLTELLCNQGLIFFKSISNQQTHKITEILLTTVDKHIGCLVNLANLYQNTDKNIESLAFLQKIIDYSSDLLDKIAANYLIIRGLMQAGGHWQQAEIAYHNYENLLSELITSDSAIDIRQEHLINLITTVAFAPYFQDRPENTHQFRNQVAQFCQNHLNKDSKLFQLKPKHPRKLNSVKTKTLKIGYISTCLRRHSVGWLSRWIFQYHDEKKFQVYAYSLGKTDDSLQSFISYQVSEFRDLSQTQDIIQIAEQINQDEIDILIDLDSVTSRKVCGVMALKPAPIQVTWLGSDASGLPAIDYFIADPYVLPESAQNYYAAKIWRLPNTYIAVDGFEIGVPTLRREQLNIPDDAVVYLSSQTSYKRHPVHVCLQIKILTKVSQSYLLIKGQNNEETIRKLFYQIAEDEGIDYSRIIFLPQVDLEATHRANLEIADIVLDTYPYNGATTTLETLWMGIPLVTKVGEQFAARNSYSMMMNAGVSEGIAWTDEEYLEWGIRLGRDIKLRQEISWKLKQSRKTSPLWDAKQFTSEMEKAYEQMWINYISG